MSHRRQRAPGPSKAALIAAFAVLCTFAAPARVLGQPNPYNSMRLVWTAPGDDGNTGQVGAYQLCYRTTPVGVDTTGWWNGTPVSQRLTLLPPLAPAIAI